MKERFQTPARTQCYLLHHFISFAAMPFCTVHNPALIAQLTGFLVIASMVLMAPASVWVRIGATRINELIELLVVSAHKFLTTSPTSVSSGHFCSRYAGASLCSLRGS